MPLAIWGLKKEFVCPIQNDVILTRVRIVGAPMIF
jgi:hypothetical protein